MYMYSLNTYMYMYMYILYRAGEGRVRGTEHTLREIVNTQLEVQ